MTFTFKIDHPETGEQQTFIQFRDFSMYWENRKIHIRPEIMEIAINKYGDVRRQIQAMMIMSEQS